MIIFLFPSIFSTIGGLHPRYYDYFDKLLRLENVKLFSRQGYDFWHHNVDIVSKTVYKYCNDYYLEY